jgi:hypothetical protein
VGKKSVRVYLDISQYEKITFLHWKNTEERRKLQIVVAKFLGVISSRKAAIGFFVKFSY